MSLVINSGKHSTKTPRKLTTTSNTRRRTTTNREFTCEICIEPTSNQFKNGDRCSHLFCTKCMIKYIQVKLDDDNIGHITCPAINCHRALDPLACAPLVGEPLFLRWCDVLCEAALVDSDKCYCPHQNCNVLIVNECGGIPMKSKCPSCKRLFCFKCMKVWHEGFRCEEVWDVKDQNDLALGRLAEQKRWMRCPRCRNFVEKGWGCRMVKCRCRIEFCYKCGKQVHQCHCIAMADPMFFWIVLAVLSFMFLLLVFLHVIRTKS